MTDTDAFRTLPSVHELAEQIAVLNLPYPRALVLETARLSLQRLRQEIAAGSALSDRGEALQAVRIALESWRSPSMRPVINATGVILHTNLGRAPLGQFVAHPGYCNLEYDVATGMRGKRDTHVQKPLDFLLGASSIAVNNGAAATFLAFHELASGFEVIVSRGELIEIGDGFRIPEILERSGATLREVGTTNRTRIEDYRNAINNRTRLLVRVHPSNFHVSGFTGKPKLTELAALAREHEIPLYEDLGSGNLIDLRSYGVDEPRVTDSLAAGANLVSFSGDKLLGGPQAGILAGDPDLIRRLRANPLFRAFRLDKLVSQALEEKLRNLILENWEAIPALQMIRLSPSQIAERARRLFPNATLIAGESVVGGGSTPNQSLPTTLVVAARQNATEAARTLRRNDPPIIAKIAQGQLLLDLRTVFRDEEQALSRAVFALPENAAI